MERYAYTNPSAEHWQNGVSRNVDEGVTCRVENLPADLCAPEERHFATKQQNDGNMRTHRDRAQGPEEEGGYIGFRFEPHSFSKSSF